jgi:pimeloyl-ACP methyl ester carboxylesterase
LALRQEATSRIGRPTTPALAPWGEADPLVAPAIGQAMAEALRNARFPTLPGRGHPPTLEKPAESTALFKTFLGENAVGKP